MAQGTPQLTPRRRALIKNLSKGMTITEAARKAGYSLKRPGQSGYQALKQIQATMPQVLERHGLTDDALIEKYLKPLLVAKETKFFAHQGEVIETRQVEALSIRKEALDMAFRLKGSYAPVEQQLQHIHEITLMEKESARRTIEKIRALESDSKTPLLAEPTEE